MNLIFGRAIKPLSNIGVGRIPGVSSLYKYIWRYFGPQGIKLTKVGGFMMYVACRDWAVTPTMMFTHVWEPAETMVCKEHIKEGMTVIDAGAYIGYYSLLASELVGSKGKVYAFEPSPECLELLHKNIQINDCKNIQVLETAIVDETGHTMFYLRPDNLSGSSISGDFQTPTILVPTTTLDDAVGDQRIDFIKMDIEGGEMKALRGMTKIIENNPDLKMIIEVYPTGLVRIGSSLEEYIDFLQHYFQLYIIGKVGLTSEVGLRDIQKATEKTGVINLFCKRRGRYA